MAALGLAPVAAVVTPSAPIGANPVAWDPPYPAVSGGSSYDKVGQTPLERAKKHLETLKYEQEHGIDSFKEPIFYSRVEADIETMKSWSRTYKANVTNERMLKLRTELAIARAEYEVKREMKIALLPEYMRSWIGSLR
jgi:hypothetical protein